MFGSPEYIKSIRRLNLVIFGIFIGNLYASLWFFIYFRMNMMEHGTPANSIRHQKLEGSSFGAISPAGKRFLQKFKRRSGLLKVF